MTDDNHEPPAMVPEPLPCPFCGPGNSIVEAYYDDWSKRYRVGCGCCGASTGITPRASDDSAAVAIARWNTRDGWNARAALDAPPDPELAESRREAEQCRADAEEARSSVRRLQRAMQDRQTEIERLREALAESRQHAKDMSNAAAGMSADLSALGQKYDALEEELAESRAEVARLTSQVELLRSLNNSGVPAVARLRVPAATSKDDLDEFWERVAPVVAEFASTFFMPPTFNSDALVRRIVGLVGKEVAAARTQGHAAGVREGIEGAIRVIESGRFLYDDAPPKRFAREVVAAIRRALAAPEPQE